MKKLVLLLATVLFGIIGNAQTKLSAHEKSIVDAQMITLVHVINSTVYQKGMSEAEFSKLAGPSKPTDNESLLLQRLYRYAVDGTQDCEILNADNSMLVAMAKSGTISESVPGAKFPWNLLLQAIIAVIEIFMPLAP